MTVNQGNFQSEAVGNLDLLNDQHATGRIGVIIQRSDKGGTTRRKNCQVVFGDGDCLFINLDNIDSDHAQSGRGTITHRVGELVRARGLCDEVDGSQFKIRSDLAASRSNGKCNQ